MLGRGVFGLDLPDEPKSSMTQHWRALRESGLIRQRRDGRKFYLTLRRDELETRSPGLIDIALAGQLPAGR